MNKTLIKTIEKNLDKKETLSYENVANLNSNSINELILDILSKTRRHYTLYKDGSIAPKTWYNRTVEDIYLLSKNYRPSTSLLEVYDSLLDLVKQKQVTTWICSDIKRRTYCLNKTRNISFQSEKIDEFGVIFEDLSLVNNTGCDVVYGRDHTKKELNIINMEQIINPTIGADIEVFIKNTENNEIVSAEPFIKGTKHEPFQYDAENKWYSTSLDNVLAEYTVPPTFDENDWVKNINKSVAYINAQLPSHLEAVMIPAAELADSELQTETAKTFGCEPTLNVWLRDLNPKPESTNPNLRSAGLHVHFGYEDSSLEVNEQIAKVFDLLLSVPAVLIEPANKRRELYGKAGEVRFKEYGVECRCLSSYFSSSETLLRWVFSQSKKVIDFVNAFRIEEVEAVADQIQEAINNSDKVLAQNLINQFQIEMPLL